VDDSQTVKSVRLTNVDMTEYTDAVRRRDCTATIPRFEVVR